MIDHGPDAGLIGDIGANEAQRGTAAFLQRPTLRLAPAGTDDTSAIRDEHFGDPFADTAGCSRDDGDLAVDLVRP